MSRTSLDRRRSHRPPPQHSRLVQRAGINCQADEKFLIDELNTRENTPGVALDGPLAIVLSSSSGASALVSEPGASAEISSSSRCCLLLNRGGMGLKSEIKGGDGGQN
jgi:hypothetical protein